MRDVRHARLLKESRRSPVHPFRKSEGGVRHRTAVFRTILIVDDSPVIHHMYKQFLSRYASARLVSAMNGAEALASLSCEPDIDLILLDINMPVMNGLKLLERLKEESAYQAIPVIVITTLGREMDIDLLLPRR